MFITNFQISLANIAKTGGNAGMHSRLYTKSPGNGRDLNFISSDEQAFGLAVAE